MYSITEMTLDLSVISQIKNTLESFGKTLDLLRLKLRGNRVIRGGFRLRAVPLFPPESVKNEFLE